MEPEEVRAETIDQYIAAFPPAVKRILRAMRKVIQQAAPEATERISYRMPTFHLNGNLVHFAAFKNHIGFFPTPSGVAAFEDELGDYVHAKGSIQFPLDEPIPYDLVRRITEYRVAEVQKKQRRKTR